MDINVYDNKVIGERIKQLRKMYGYTRELLSEKLGISQKFLYEIEKGHKGFSVQILISIANEFSVSCNYIISGNCFFGCNSELQEVLSLFTTSQREELVTLLRSISRFTAIKHDLDSCSGPQCCKTL